MKGDPEERAVAVGRYLVRRRRDSAGGGRGVWGEQSTI